jgi:hypothetical protein
MRVRERDGELEYYIDPRFIPPASWPKMAGYLYLFMLDAQWDLGCLPAPPEQLRQLMNADRSEWLHWPTIEHKFPVDADGVRCNPELEQRRIEVANGEEY